MPNNIKNQNRFGDVTDQKAGSLRHIEDKCRTLIADTKWSVVQLTCMLYIAAPAEDFPSSLAACAWMWIALKLASFGVTRLAACIGNRQTQTLLNQPASRYVTLWGHTSALIGGWEAYIWHDAAPKGDFSNPINLIGAVRAIESHVSLLAKTPHNIFRLRFRANPEFFELWCDQSPEEVSALRGAIVPELDREIRGMLESVRQDSASGQRIFDVTVGFHDTRP